MLPVVTAVVRATRHHWFPVGDAALLYIRVRDTFTGNHPLLGSWTSASLSLGKDVNNPGATYAHLLGPIAHLLGPGPGAAIGVGLANAVAIIGISAASRHIGGWAMQRWLLLGCAALAWTMGSELLFDLWQPHALLFPFLAYLVLLLGITVGRTRCVPWAVFVASLLVQTHIGYAYIVATLTPTAIVILWWQHRPVTGAALRSGLRSQTTVVSFVVFTVVWAQSFVEQLFGAGQGNLARLVSSSGGGDVTPGLSTAGRITAAVVLLPPWWLRRGYSSTVQNTKLTQTADGPELILPGLPSTIVAALALVIGVGVLILLARTCARAGLRLQSNAVLFAAIGIVLGVACLTILTIGRVGFAAHHARWLWTFGVFVHIVAAWSLVSLVLQRRAVDGHLGATADRAWRNDRIVDVSLGALVVAFTILNIPYFAEQQGPVVDAKAMTELRRIFPSLAVLAAHQPVVFDITNLRVFEPYSTAVMMQLQQLDIEFRVADEPMVRQLGNGRRADGSEPTTIFQLEGTAARRYEGPACLLAVADGLTSDEAKRAEGTMNILSGGFVSGQVFVDPAGLDDGLVTLVDTAVAGDLVSAQQIVGDGLLGTWRRDLRVTIDPDLAKAATSASGEGDVDAAIDLVERWVLSTYGLFATPSTACTP